jgi:Cu/Ag efflux pump CusA
MVTLGGLTTPTPLNLLVLPARYLPLGRGRQPRIPAPG